MKGDASLWARGAGACLICLMLGGCQGVWIAGRHYEITATATEAPLFTPAPAPAPPRPEPVPAPPPRVEAAPVAAAPANAAIARRGYDSAGAELNVLYSKLSAQLGPAQQWQLAQQQNAWLQERQDSCPGTGIAYDDCAAALTQARITELAKQLDGLETPANATQAAQAAPAMQVTPVRVAPRAEAMSVPATAMPWLSRPGGLNSAYPFGLADGTAPIVIPLSGLGVAAGQSLAISYTGGKIRLGPGTAPTDAAGYAGLYDHGGVGMVKKPFPSSYMHPYPINLGELVGTFTTADGQIVGKPFAIGDGPVTKTVPAGAARLQLGINDDIYGGANAATANTGAFSVRVAPG